jgi:hypothetical protein
MTDYSKMIIYKIQHQDDENLIYIGSTTNFTKRKHLHKYCSLKPNYRDYNIKLYKMIRDNGGWESFRMIEVKPYPCENKREAEKEEDRIMLEMKATMNNNRACRSETQYKIDNKEIIAEKNKEYYNLNKEQKAKYKREYNILNKEKIAEKNKEYRILNKERIKEYTKEYIILNKEKKREYNILNKEKITNYKKEYYIHNKEIYKEKGSKKINCECGSVVCSFSLSNHKQTKKHLQYINELL